MQAVLDTLGHDGHSCWWILVELCAEKLHKNLDEEYSDAHCNFVFNERFLRDSLRVGGAKMARILNQYSTLALLSFQITENEISIHMPKLLECLDRDSKRARTVRAPSAPKNKRKKEIKRKRDIKGPTEPFQEIWNTETKTPPKCLEWSTDRISLAAKFLETRTQDDWRKVCEKIEISDFLSGRNGKWKCSIDWALNPKNARKVLEGNYDNSEPPSPTQSANGDSWEQVAARVLAALLKHGSGSKATVEIERELGPDLWRIVIRAGTQRIRDVKRGSFQLREIAGLLKDASAALGGAA